MEPQLPNLSLFVLILVLPTFGISLFVLLSMISFHKVMTARFMKQDEAIARVMTARFMKQDEAIARNQPHV